MIVGRASGIRVFAASWVVGTICSAKMKGGKLGSLSSTSAILNFGGSNPENMQSAMTKVKPVPTGYHNVTPSLIVDGAANVIDFIKRTFNAEEGMPPVKRPDGRIAHHELKIGDSIIMLSDPTPEFKASQSQLYVYIDDIDATYHRALKAGATVVKEPTNQFYGDRSATVKDPTGNIWSIATHVEDVPPEEMQRRMKEQNLR